MGAKGVVADVKGGVAVGAVGDAEAAAGVVGGVEVATATVAIAMGMQRKVERSSRARKGRGPWSLMVGLTSV